MLHLIPSRWPFSRGAPPPDPGSLDGLCRQPRFRCRRIRGRWLLFRLHRTSLPNRSFFPRASNRSYACSSICTHPLYSVLGVFDSGAQLNSVKIISDMEGKPKGFGYVEFSTLNDLKQALAMTGEVRRPLIIWVQLVLTLRCGDEQGDRTRVTSHKSSLDMHLLSLLCLLLSQRLFFPSYSCRLQQMAGRAVRVSVAEPRKFGFSLIEQD